MKQLAVFYGNCQMDGITHFLKKTRMVEDYSFVVWHNWQCILGEQNPDAMMADVRRADLLVYQPCRGYKCTNGRDIPGTGDMLASCRASIPISLAYQFNMGFFPILNVSPGPDGWITAELLKQKAWASNSIPYHSLGLMKDYNAGALHFDCARRFLECLAEQSGREEETDIKMAPWILDAYRDRRLFLTQNHPTSYLFEELARRVLLAVYGSQGCYHYKSEDFAAFGSADENEAGMNGVMPVHQSVVNELGLNYSATEGAHEYYRDLLEKMVNGK